MVRLQQVFWRSAQKCRQAHPAARRITVESEVSGGRPYCHLALWIPVTGIGTFDRNEPLDPKTFSQGDQWRVNSGGLGFGACHLKTTRETFMRQKFMPSAWVATKVRPSLWNFRWPKLLGKSAAVSNGSAPNSDGKAFAGSIPLKISAFCWWKTMNQPAKPWRFCSCAGMLQIYGGCRFTASITEALAQRRNFHVLISDIGLPDGNGCDLMNEMRKRGSIQGIALTGSGMEQDVTRSRAVF